MSGRRSLRARAHAAGGSLTASVRRVGDAVLGLVCLLLLLLLRLMRAHMPPVHPDTPPGVRLSLGLVWTATTGEGLWRPVPQLGPTTRRAPGWSRPGHSPSPSGVAQAWDVQCVRWF